MAAQKHEICFECGVESRQPEEVLCKSCLLDYKMCYECGEKERNHPFKLCTDCYQRQRTNSSRDGGHPRRVPVRPSAEKPTLVRLDTGQQTYKDIAGHFEKDWVKLTQKCPTPPKPLAIYAVQNHQLNQSFQRYADGIRESNNHTTNSNTFFHGTKLCCNLVATDSCCDDSNCGICGISLNGFDAKRIGTNIPRFQRFGKGIYLAPNSSKCHDYTQGNPIYDMRAQLLCLVACGAKYELLHDNTALLSPPEQFHSVYGKSGGSLNYDEIVVFDASAVMPQFVIVYKLDGVEKIAK